MNKETFRKIDYIIVLKFFTFSHLWSKKLDISMKCDKQ